jgi:hypothetical protein
MQILRSCLALLNQKLKSGPGNSGSFMAWVSQSLNLSFCSYKVAIIIPASYSYWEDQREWCKRKVWWGLM